MKLLIGFLMAVAAFGQCGTYGQAVWNPLASFGEGGWDCTGVVATATTPASPVNSIQFNNSGAFGASSAFTVDATNRRQLFGQANIEFDPITSPGAPTVALSGAAGNINNGTHVYLVTYVTALGESAPGTVSATITVVDKTADGQVSLSSIPVSANALVLTKNIYRTKAGNVTPTSPTDYRDFFLLTNIPNATTVATDNTADASLTATFPPFDSTAGAVYWGSTLVTKWDSLGPSFTNFSLGRNGAMYLDNTLVQGQPHRTKVMHFCCGNGGGDNQFIGQNSGAAQSTSGAKNLGYGGNALIKVAGGNGNIGVGANTLSEITTQNNNIGIGAYALVSNVGARNTVVGGYYINVVTEQTSGDDNTFVGYAVEAGASRTGATAIGSGAAVTADGAVSIGKGVTNAVANSVNIGTNSTLYFALPGVVGSAGQASCWKTSTQLSYCDSVVGVAGACTCH